MHACKQSVSYCNFIKVQINLRVLLMSFTSNVLSQRQLTAMTVFCALIVPFPKVTSFKGNTVKKKLSLHNKCF